MKTRTETAMTYLDRNLVVPPNVFAPAPMSQLLGNCVLREVREADRVLDMGTGSGINAILAASRSKDVVAVDINPEAIVCAKQNAELNSVSDRIQFFVSDLFEKVEGKFDLIIFDPPFRWFAARDMLERSITDEKYAGLTTFFKEVRNYLPDTGRILVFFGSSGDINYLRALIHQTGFRKSELARKELLKDNWTVTYHTYRLTVA